MHDPPLRGDRQDKERWQREAPKRYALKERFEREAHDVWEVQLDREEEAIEAEVEARAREAAELDALSVEQRITRRLEQDRRPARISARDLPKLPNDALRQAVRIRRERRENEELENQPEHQARQQRIAKREAKQREIHSELNSEIQAEDERHAGRLRSIRRRAEAREEGLPAVDDRTRVPV